jgi:hypothetical protein
MNQMAQQTNVEMEKGFFAGRKQTCDGQRLKARARITSKQKTEIELTDQN